MHTNSQHIIHKLTLEVNTTSVQQGYDIKDNVRSFIDTHVVPAIEQYIQGLTASFTADQVIQLDKLELTINQTSRDWNTSGLAQAIQLEFEKAVSVTQSEVKAVSFTQKKESGKQENHFDQMDRSMFSDDAPKVENLRVLSKNKHIASAWIAFLNDGISSWFTSEIQKLDSRKQEELLLKSILLEVAKLNKSRQLVFETKQARHRLIQQFSVDFLIAFVGVFARKTMNVNYTSVVPNHEQAIDVLLRNLLNDSSTHSKIRFWELIFGMLGLDSTSSFVSDESFLLEVQQIFPEAHNYLKQSKGDRGKTSNKKEKQSASTRASETGSLTTPFNENDASILGIRLLEWVHVLKGKTQSQDKYCALQTAFISRQDLSSSHLIVNDAEEKTPASESVRQVQRDTDIPLVSDDAVRINGNDNPSIEEESTKKEKNDQQESAANKQALNKQLEEKQDEQTSEESRSAESLSEKVPDPTPEKIDSRTEGVDQINLTSELKGSPAQESDIQSNNEIKEKAAVIEERDQKQKNNTLASESSTINTDKPVRIDEIKDQGLKSEQPLFKDQEAYLLVENAGLVLLHPFLKHFFTGIGLLNKDNVLIDKVLAAHLLHYAATGRENDFEQQMAFEKYLVGIDPFESIPREVSLSESMKQEVENLLLAVRENWKPLKSSSAAAVRETFLQRSGKLINEHPNPRLVVERQTVDILLNQLSWTISIIRFPWLEELIYVEW
ncbi:MAG: contractile injection system tape measure protein [Fluviicola sp.]|nr:contractile injection system tape measure protein [Fluviicola sp.]